MGLKWNREPVMTINGTTLTAAQAMTVRVAIEAFASDLTEGLGEDETGKAITAGYKARINEIRELIFQ